MHEKRIAQICAGFVLIFAFTLLFSNFAGAATTADANTITATCTDSDGGINYDKVGEIYINSAPSNIDWCKDSISLEEFYCKDSSVLSEVYSCPNGCSNGACLPSTAQTGEISVTIWDEQKNYIKAKINLTLYSDSGKLVSAQGTDTGYSVFYSVPVGTYYIGAEDPGNKYSATKTELFKVYANSGSAVIITMKAQITTGCTDSDGGKNYYVKGIADARVNGEGSFAEDHCVLKEGTSGNIVDSCQGSDCYLEEGYCADSAPMYESWVPCTSGCKDGACMK